MSQQEYGELVVIGLVLGFAISGVVILAAIWVRDRITSWWWRRRAANAFRQALVAGHARAVGALEHTEPIPIITVPIPVITVPPVVPDRPVAHAQRRAG